MKRLNERPLMFISYYHGQSGGVMSEWAEDKLRVLKVQNRRTLLITSVLSSEQDEDVLHHSRVPSLSYRDYCSESKVKSSVSILNRRGSHYRYLLASSLGRFFDIVTKKYVSNTSNAMWSWAFACIPKALFYYFRFGARDVFATGGATGGHLLALLISYLPNTNIYLEFQDPLFGAEMPRTKHNERGILRLERLMIERSKKTVFVTKTAAYEAQERHMLHAGKVAAVYPGAWDFFPDTRSSNPGSSRALENFKIAHIGSLYGSRNLDNFFKALDEIYLDDSSTRGFVKIVNKGGLYLDQKEKYLQRVDFIHEDLTNRVDGLKLAKGVDSLLLVQHTDKRSYQTIPYKLYDYLNLGRPIIAITSNLELEELLRSYGAYIADSRSISSIKSTLLAVFNDVKKNRLIHPEPTSKLDIREQFNKIFSK